MEQTGTVKLARVLKVLLTIVFVCNIMALFVVPALVVTGTMQGDTIHFLTDLIRTLFRHAYRMLQDGSQYQIVLTIFLLFCGSCTAVVLWQARGVLGTIVKQDTFTMPNARRMKRAAICCFLIGAAALLRTIWGFFFYQSLAPLFTYNALFTPIFIMAGLLCMVMSALFRQAAELKEENDLTI